MELQALRLRRGALRDKAQGGDVHGALTELCTELWGSILMFQTILAVSPIRKAVVADRHNYTGRHNPITYVTRIELKFIKCKIL
jgi:hypothetical protein